MQRNRDINIDFRKTKDLIGIGRFINYKKGPMLLIHTFKNIYDTDNDRKLYIAGKFQIKRYIIFKQR